MTERPLPQSHEFAPTVSCKVTADLFNETYPVGTRVRYWPLANDPKCFDTETRTPAWTLGHGDAVVSLVGFSGGVALDHLAHLAPVRKWLLANDNTPDECPGCGHTGDGPWPWWDGNEKCPKCGVAAVASAPWSRGLLHPNGYEGDEGLLMLRDGESPEDCIHRNELDVASDWRLVRARRAVVRPSQHPIFDMDSVLENLDEWVCDGNADEWHAPWGDQIIFGKDGAAQALAAALDAWAAVHLEVRGWVIHPEDRRRPKETNQ